MHNTISAIIVDDEPRLAMGLQAMLQKYCPHVQVLAVCVHANDAIEQLNRLSPQLLFLDISMPGKNAFDLLAEIKEIHFEIIFITAHDQYSIQAFKYSAVDYLLKPVDEEELADAVERATQRIMDTGHRLKIDTLLQNWQQKQLPDQQKLCLPTINGFQVVCVKDIIYCEAANSYTYFMLTNQKKICASRSLLEYESLLEDLAFFRTHKSFLVNLQHIAGYTKGEGGTVTMSDGSELEVSRRKKDLFLVKIKEFFKH